MSNLEKNNQSKGLGRGLGSLFGSELSQDDAKSVLSNLSEEKKAETFVVEAPAHAPVVVAPAAQISDEDRIWQIPVEKLKINNFQPRKHFDKEKITELSLSIKEQGILQPIVARRSIKGDFEIIAGERRWRAAQAAGLLEVPVILKDIDDQKSLELALIENIQRENLNAIEEAEAYEQLAREFSLTQQQISEKVGKERATVANSLRLLTLVPEVRNMIITGEITAGHAKALLAITDPAAQKAVAKKIASEKLTVRAAEKLIRSANKTKEAQSKDETTESLISLMAEDIQKILGTKVKIDYTDGAGKISIFFYSDAEFNQITDKLKRG
ncbi:MAG: ParB/RepB/Spo0J family partition protein [Bdellovibrionota bacterium]